ncbi:MAG TPA: ABC transporter substrate-binding protein [Stellaceae bacterium]|nr:ABC transporter substrate-binding protein [Stellaceae bacterium]
MTTPDNGPVVADRVPSQPQTLRPIDIAFADYDRTRPLIDGRVKAKGIELRATNKWVGDFCTRPVYEEFDAAEMSLSWYVAARDRGEPCIAIPIFPLRDPVLAFVYARTDSQIAQPSDLVGKRIGLEGFRYTINLVLRGVFKDHYGLSPEQVTWVTSEAELNDYVPPANIKIELRQGKTSAQKLKDGEVDAIFAPRVPREFQNSEPWIRRLFPDCQGEVQRLVKKLGYIPVSHTIVMKKELAAREPWIAISLYNAFVEAQKAADECCSIEKMTSYVDSMFILEQQKAAYGDDPFRHGFAPNRKVMEDFIRYAHEQNYISRRLTAEELFVPETLTL